MNYPLGENLEVVVDDQGKEGVRCAKCGTNLSQSPTSWRQAARTRVLPATAASPLMSILESEYHLEQVLCPSCGALFHTEMMENRAGSDT